MAMTTRELEAVRGLSPTRSTGVWLVTCLLAVTGLSQDGTMIGSVRVTLDKTGLSRIEKADPAMRSALGNIEISAITYLSDGLRVRGYLAVPREGSRLPCAIFNRGGNKDFGALDDLRAATLLGPLASWGYIAVASQYRGNAGGEGREQFGGADVDDVLNLIPLLASLPRADVSRIGMVGWSRGGMMTYLALTRTDRVSAAVIGGGMSDLLATAGQRPEIEEVFADLIPGYPADREASLTARSAVRWVDKLAAGTPLLLLHGTSDRRVDPTQTMALAALLLAAKHPFRLVLLEGGDHGVSEHSGEVDRLTKDWLDRYVRYRKPWPSLEPHGP